ncbi:hypothetical protein [Butyricicoccus porcorum]|uniref:Uncharacterized protein n=1 Tax=Butyricicoccus porcorum TaxID=1945634 RepID=A0A252F0Y4_9FIRM|nr:hypothetical protein [Butyricicoccus porcorum]MDY4484079.1 hypothetical protein [Butyricicoccus porcorum]OUM19437.1 hypothetical protein CBW42_13405 [Butyricicoccus porcorum]
MKLLTATLLPLELSAQIKDEILPIVLFFGMFFVVFSLGGGIIRHMPRKPGSMLDEILNETWDDNEDQKDEERNADASEQAAAEPVQGEQTDAADGYDRK